MSRIGRLLNTSVEVWRAELTDDGAGGQNRSWTLQSTPRARLSQPTARERQVADQSRAELTHTVYLAGGTDVRRKDELRRDDLVLEVFAVFAPSVPGAYLRADCTEQQPAPGR